MTKSTQAVRPKPPSSPIVPADAPRNALGDAPGTEPPQAGRAAAVRPLVEQRLTILRRKAQDLRQQRRQLLDTEAARLVLELTAPAQSECNTPDALTRTVGGTAARTDPPLARIEREISDIDAALSLGDEALARAARQDRDRHATRVAARLDRKERDRRRLTIEAEDLVAKLTARIAALDVLEREMEAAGGEGGRDLRLRTARNGNAHRRAAFVAARLSRVLPIDALTQALLNAKATRSHVGDRRLRDMQTDLRAAWAADRDVAAATD